MPSCSSFIPGILACLLGTTSAMAAAPGAAEPPVVVAAADTPGHTWSTAGASRTNEGVSMAQAGAPDQDLSGTNPWLLGIGGAMALVFVVSRRRSDDRA